MAAPAPLPTAAPAGTTPEPEGPPSVWDIMCGICVMNMGSILFSSVIQSLAAHAASTPNQSSPTIVKFIVVVVIVIVKINGWRFLYEALHRISQRHAVRADALGIMGANIGALWAMSVLQATMGSGDSVSWDRTILMASFGLDVGYALGGLLCFEEAVG